jgi:fused signal recognition particle receptor
MAESSWSLGRALRGMFVKQTIDENTWEDLETALLTADFGPDITERIVDELREKVERYRTTDPKDLQRMLRETLEEHFAKFDTTLRLTERPAVVLVVGVNGVGKTTTIGKFASYLKRFGRTVVVGAADTFRAAAVDQLATWAERGGATIVRPQHEGQDPASVAFQTIEHAIRTGTEIVLVDTAGRLHTKGGLMDELTKIRRVIEKQAPISEVLLVLDATTGQNGVMQAEAFLEHAGVTGLVLTKLDGSARGGVIVPVAEQFGLPVKFVGVGESADDLEPFRPEEFLAALLEGSFAPAS